MDLFYISSQGHGIWYSIDRGVLSVEFKATTYNDRTRTVDFRMTQILNKPQFVYYDYFQVDVNAPKVIGVQFDKKSQFILALPSHVCLMLTSRNSGVQRPNPKRYAE